MKRPPTQSAARRRMAEEQKRAALLAAIRRAFCQFDFRLERTALFAALCRAFCQFDCRLKPDLTPEALESLKPEVTDESIESFVWKLREAREARLAERRPGGSFLAEKLHHFRSDVIDSRTSSHLHRIEANHATGTMEGSATP